VVDTPGEAMAVACGGGIAFVADDGGGLQVADVSVPAAPVLVASLPTLGRAYDVVLGESFLYLADYEAGIQAVDVSDPQASSIVGMLPVPDPALLPDGSAWTSWGCGWRAGSISSGWNLASGRGPGGRWSRCLAGHGVLLLGCRVRLTHPRRHGTGLDLARSKKPGVPCLLVWAQRRR
jgi:hypothetical protein